MELRPITAAAAPRQVLEARVGAQRVEAGIYFVIRRLCRFWNCHKLGYVERAEGMPQKRQML